MIEPPKNDLEARVRERAIFFEQIPLCEYRHSCEGYDYESYTCTKKTDKTYCGIYRDFVAGKISRWVRRTV
jgi:hypothetical protein